MATLPAGVDILSYTNRRKGAVYIRTFKARNCLAGRYELNVTLVTDLPYKVPEENLIRLLTSDATVYKYKPTEARR